jgi:hypothetical protein
MEYEIWAKYKRKLMSLLLLCLKPTEVCYKTNFNAETTIIGVLQLQCILSKVRVILWGVTSYTIAKVQTFVLRRGLICPNDILTCVRGEGIPLVIPSCNLTEVRMGDHLLCVSSFVFLL